MVKSKIHVNIMRYINPSLCELSKDTLLYNMGYLQALVDVGEITILERDMYLRRDFNDIQIAKDV